MTGLPAHLVGFVAALRRHGVPVGPGETVDAARVLTALDLLEREQLREGLAAAVLRRGGQRPVFDPLFDLWFPPRTDRAAPDGGDGDGDGDGPAAGPAGPPGSGPGDPAPLRARLAELLAEPDPVGLRALAVAVVDALGGAPAGRSGAASWSAHRALDRLAPQTLLAQVLSGMGAPVPDHPPDELARELARREVRERVAAFRGLVRAEVLRRTAQERGRDVVARSAAPPPAEQRELLSLRADDLAELRRTVAPLARSLATRLAARRRRASRGRLDLRRTLRRSLSTAGVPLHPALRRPRPARPELVVLCDVSGSVAGFSSFTLMLVQALREQFSAVRVFAFVDRVDEVTGLFAPGADPARAVARVLTEADVVAAGHSDYGGVLADLARAGVVGPRTSLLVLGDARTNHGHPGTAALAELVGAARHAHWLNPEPRADWGSGDSVALRYAAVLPMHECRTARQLADVVAGLLPG